MRPLHNGADGPAILAAPLNSADGGHRAVPRRRYTDDIVSEVLRAAAKRRARLADVLAHFGVPERTYHHWRHRYPPVEAEDLTRVRQLERELRISQAANRRLRRDFERLRAALGKPWRRLRPGAQPSDGS